MNSRTGSSHSRPFRFKQFSLSDEGCAMKIGTDGVLLGSVAAGYPAARVLDIGTGCGLIALMIAQETEAPVTAIDSEEGAINAARKNVAQSPWPNQVKVIQCRFQEFVLEVNESFDLLVCNPPYFRKSLLSPDEQRNLARHSGCLPAPELLDGVARLISLEGHFLIILPAEQEMYVETLALESGLSCRRKILVHPSPGRKPKRIILGFSQQAGPLLSETVVIENEQRHAYSEAYMALTRKYYLDF